MGEPSESLLLAWKSSHITENEWLFLARGCEVVMGGIFLSGLWGIGMGRVDIGVDIGGDAGGVGNVSID